MVRRKSIAACIASFALAFGLVPTAPAQAEEIHAVDLFSGLVAGQDYVEGQLVVSLKTNDIDSIALLAEEETTEIGDNVVVLNAESDDEANALAAELEHDSQVNFVEPNYIYSLLDGDDPLEETELNDPDLFRVWSLYDDNANMFDFWDSYRADGEVTVAVIDSGIDSDHPDLVNNIVDPVSVVDPTLDSDAESYEDIQGHGTHVAGIVSAESNNGIGISGISYNAKIMPIRAFFRSGTKTGATSADLYKGVEYAISQRDEYNVRVINLSLGYEGKSMSEKNHKVLSAAMDLAWDAGILCVCASGNGSSAGTIADSLFPASYEKTLCVGSICSDHTRASTSNGGEALQIMAPGDQIWSTSWSGSYVTKSGTSMATPFVSAIAAICFLQNPELTPQNVIDAITSTATDLGDEGWDKAFGYGQINPLKAVQACAKGQVLNRFYNSYTGEHLYSSSLAEKDSLIAAGWNFEGSAWTSPFDSKTEVYRLYNPYTSDHHYTTSQEEYAKCMTNGWKGEGLAWYASDDEDMDVYRLFNPYVEVGTHHYTTSKSEYLNLAQYGWKQEGTAWYAIT